MTYGELKEKFTECGFITTAAEDIPGGFAKKGHGLYGNCDDMEVVSYHVKGDIVHVTLK